MGLGKLGRYDLVRVLGHGAMGRVYEGFDPNLDRKVAIKTIQVENLSKEACAEYEARFRTEALSAARLQHPNIVSLYDSERDGGIAYLVMEFLAGHDLKHHLDAGVVFSLGQTVAILRDVLSALDYAHQRNIIHRDVKPANLLMQPNGRIKLTDFGVARLLDTADSTRTHGAIVGTLKYMSPEQVQGLVIDTRADVFAAGVILYQLLTGHQPFDGGSDFAIIHEIIDHIPSPPSSFNPRVSPELDAVVMRAMMKEPADRFATARDFALALQAATRRSGESTAAFDVRLATETDAAASPFVSHSVWPADTVIAPRDLESELGELVDFVPPHVSRSNVADLPAPVAQDPAKVRSLAATPSKSKHGMVLVLAALLGVAGVGWALWPQAPQAPQSVDPVVSLAPSETLIAPRMPSVPEAVAVANAASVPRVVTEPMRTETALPARPLKMDSAKSSGHKTATQEPLPPHAEASSEQPSAHLPVRSFARPVLTATPPTSPKEACSERILLGYFACIRDQCAKPQFYPHAVCVDMREKDEWRKASSN